jgi:8-oxo-dGTP pyrophosphatase MutT (NUDIX family)
MSTTKFPDVSTKERTTRNAIVEQLITSSRGAMTIISQRAVFTGRVIQVNVERVQLPNASVADLEIIHHPGGAAIVALDDKGNVCLLRQFRHAANGFLWELPAGKIDNKEPPLQTAQRELLEEAGAHAKHWESLGDYVSSPGVFTEVVHLFLATGLEHRDVNPEEHEVIEVHWRPLDDTMTSPLRQTGSTAAQTRELAHANASARALCCPSQSHNCAEPS